MRCDLEGKYEIIPGKLRKTQGLNHIFVTSAL
jgi:hypothetical protein